MNISGLLARLDRIKDIIPVDLSRIRYGIIHYSDEIKDYVVPKKIRTKAMKDAGPGSYRIIIEKKRPTEHYVKKYGMVVDGKAEGTTPEEKEV